MSQHFVRPFGITILALAALPWNTLHATGDYTSPRWLDKGGVAADHSPEFYWVIEARKLALPFKPAEKRTALKAAEPAPDPAHPPAEADSYSVQAGKADLADFLEAIKAGRLKVADAAKAQAQHEAARDAIAAANETTKEALPEEAASEFADYHQGAFAFHCGQAHYAEARAAWERLLKRPKEERHDRSVWAAFMLGKLALYAKQADAPKWFQLCRQLAKDGFADALGLAADSYGWEAKSELEQDHLEKAAALYLTQLALGDDSAVVSLKALVPDRDAIEGTMNFTPLPLENADPAARKKTADEDEKRLAGALLRAARDPLLRKLVSAHILATETVSASLYYEDTDAVSTGGDPKPEDRAKRWLAAIEKSAIKKIDNADQLGWLAYTAGNYAEAERWLKLDSTGSYTALWLKAKLLRRAGKYEDSAQLMAQVIKGMTAPPNGALVANADSDYSNGNSSSGFLPLASASGDLGSLQLSRGDFISAFDAFYAGDLTQDAAFVAEHVLTADELKTYVDNQVKWTAENEAAAAGITDHWGGEKPIPGRSIRWLLGRRLVREDRYAEARPYLPVKYREVLDRYAAALTKGANEKLPKAERARAWFDAAWIARYDGMEIMGTEEEPDGFSTEGSFEPTNVAGERETGTTTFLDYKNDKEVRVSKPLKMFVPVTPEEKRRLAQYKPAPNKRFHYRYIAAGLGWKAALLLPDNSEELADVLNTSGGWIKRDDKAADKYFLAIKQRAAKSEIGKAALSKRWFIEHYGPWSKDPNPPEEPAPVPTPPK